jgi:BirA family biotin operon repressor/biotin-[acetyl-CoA-carboxylase] ligase
LKKNAKIGNSIIYLDQTDSTNNYTAKLVNEAKAEFGQVILADEQFEGRGQRDAKWLSEIGKNLLFSVFVTLDNLSVTNQLFLMQYTAVSICEGLQDLGLKAQIKWPNDLVVDGKKIGGILIENQLIGNKIVSSIIGVGLNVNQLNFSEFTATSIYEQLGIEQNRIEVLGKLLDKLNYYFQFIELDAAMLNKQYLKNLYKLNTVAKFHSEKMGEFHGEIIGVDALGKLCVIHEVKEYRFEVKQIIFL